MLGVGLIAVEDVGRADGGGRGFGSLLMCWLGVEITIHYQCGKSSESAYVQVRIIGFGQPRFSGRHKVAYKNVKMGRSSRAALAMYITMDLVQPKSRT